MFITLKTLDMLKYYGNKPLDDYKYFITSDMEKYFDGVPHEGEIFDERNGGWRFIVFTDSKTYQRLYHKDWIDRIEYSRYSDLDELFEKEL